MTLQGGDESGESGESGASGSDGWETWDVHTRSNFKHQFINAILILHFKPYLAHQYITGFFFHQIKGHQHLLLRFTFW